MPDIKQKWKWVWLPVIFAAGIFVGLKTGQKPPPPHQHFALRDEGEYTFINPLLECEQGEEAFAELKPFKGKLEDLVNKAKQNNSVDFVSVYYRDLNNGPWVGINERENFSPASLLKLPLMMAYFKMAEADPSLMEKTYTYEGDENNPNLVQPLPAYQTLEKGKLYPVSDLINKMIVYSDNRAFYLLADNVDTNVLRNIFTEFALSYPVKSDDDILVNIKNYSGFFRILFNSSFLSRNSSEKVLEILSRAEYQEGLKAGVPEGVAVAHKFGERFNSGPEQEQLHDCGIVYYPKHPYLLCVMTRGDESSQLAKTITDISRLVYEEVDRQNRE